MHGDEGPGHHRVPARRRPAPVGAALDLDRHLDQAQRALGPRRRHLDQAVDPLAPAHRPTDDPALRSVSASTLVARRRGRTGTSAAPSVTRQERQPVDVELVLHRLVPRHPLHAVDGDARRPARRIRRAAPPRRSGAGPAGSGRARRRGRPRPGRRRPRSASGDRSDALGLGVGGRRQHAELPAQLVLPWPRPGTGTGRSPRRGRRRPPCGPRRTDRSTSRRARSLALLPGLLEQLLEGLLPRREGPPGLEPGEGVDACRGAPGASRCWGSTGPSRRARPGRAGGTTPPRATPTG